MNNAYPLKMTHLRFTLTAEDSIHLGGYYAGNNLRNALANVMLKSVCPENPRREKPAPEHARVCPVCWLLAAEQDPGEVVRAYTFMPPVPPPEVVLPGEDFHFSVTLFGRGEKFLPYFMLAIPEMGRCGVGRGRGRFLLKQIEARDPFRTAAQTLLAPDDNAIKMPEARITWESVEDCTGQLLTQLNGDGTLCLQFLTPTRLIFRGNLLKSPDFGIFFRRLLKRIDDLGRHFADLDRRPQDDLAELLEKADKVRLIEDHMAWEDLFVSSGRTRRKNPMGGFLGSALYHADDWQDLLPWLVIGQLVQVGKYTSKGHGVYQIHVPH